MQRTFCASPFSLPRVARAPVSKPPHSHKFSTATKTFAASPSRNKVATSAFALAFTVGVAAYFFLPDQSRAAPTSTNKHLSPAHFTQATVIASEPSGPNTKLITVAIPKHLIPPSHDPATCGFSPIWSVCIKDDDIQVERAYTPLHGMNDDGQMQLWIKRYPNGEVGRWLHSKQVGEQIELRGPLMTWMWRDNNWDEVIMISGGTGITPFYQLLHDLKTGSIVSSNTRFTLLHSARTPEELPPPSILWPITNLANENPGKFQFYPFVDTQDGTVPPISLSNIRVGRIGEAAIRQCLGLAPTVVPWWKKFFIAKTSPADVSQRKVLILVCGPDPMINAIAGPFGRNFSQGPVAGILGSLGFSSNQVRKL
ncbi:ferredoxin reductase-like protein [Cyathus striatus]|nr:ferredoxin reductase-like protein [Cyathus striatus]